VVDDNLHLLFVSPTTGSSGGLLLFFLSPAAGSADPGQCGFRGARADLRLRFPTSRDVVIDGVHLTSLKMS
jgi:hypothetical protein